MTDELKRLEPESRANGFQNLSSFQGKDKGRIDQNNNYESKITDARLLQLTSGTDNKELFQGISDADKKLFLLTSETNGILITMDGRLTELCHKTNVRVLNLDELHKKIKPKILLKYRQEVYVKLKPSKHKNSNDAIANYEDIMIMVKNGASFVGQRKSVRIISDPSHSKNGHTALAKLSSPNAEPPTVKAEASQTPPTP